MSLEEQVEILDKEFRHSPPEEVLTFFLRHFKNKIALASSLGIEDQVLTDIAVKIDPEVRIFTLDTGRLFPETYKLIERTNRKYNIRIEVYFPKAGQVQQLVKKDGVNGFYYSIEQRKQCCRIRKMEPLVRAFQGLDVWICGLRHEQSITRKNLHLVEWDSKHGLIKLNPLINYTEEDIRAYVRKHQVPYNPLHDKGFPSIGCQPCTRAIQPGEDIRAGRWWWENPEHKECGLHQ